MKRQISLEWYYPFPVETLWDCFTNPEMLKQWSSLSTKGDFKPEVGFKWMETQKPRKGWDGKMYFEVLEVIPMKKLRYSFRGGPEPGKITLDTIVTWDFESINNGTKVHLLHTGFEGIKGLVTSLIMTRGWDKNTGKALLKFLKSRISEYHEL
jgi:uncharacterized protein YndB with AHSA1/START domain